MRRVLAVGLFVAVSLLGVSFAECPSADISGNCFVDLEDFATLSAAWLSDDSPSPNWNPACDISDPNDGVINELDLEVLIAEWLDEGVPEDPCNLVWVSINDSGAGMKDGDGNPISYGGFDGQMSKYEITNAQYCEFLNDALASGDVAPDPADPNRVIGASGSNGGADFVGEIYFDTYAVDPESQITWNGTSFSVRSRDGHDMSNHPVVEVSWHGATAFCNYYGYRLPTEWEWQAVADHHGEFIYGCGTTIDQAKANYYDNGLANPLGLSSSPYTSPVNHYSSYGYGMNDMAGNVWEWTSSLWDPGYSYRVIHGGSWVSSNLYCTVSGRDGYDPSGTGSHVGFRVCR